MLLIEDIYQRSMEVEKALGGLPTNEKLLVLFYAIHLIQNNAIISEFETHGEPNLSP